MFTFFIYSAFKKEQLVDYKLLLWLSFLTFKSTTLSNYEPYFEQDDLL